MPDMAVEKAMWAGWARTLALWVLAVLVSVSVGVLLGAKPAHAKTFTVTSTSDGADIALDGSCDADPRVFVVACTLRAAIQDGKLLHQRRGGHYQI
jgi:CSLREA domain-containing protein